jgi:mono/diheme cytochrome c family protein
MRLSALILVAAALAAPATFGEEAAVERGKALYEVYCQTCHGPSAAGKGVAAENLRVKPTDLTRLSAGNEGKFPVERTYRIIDGREKVEAHRRDVMPIWGLTFQDPGSDANQEVAVREKIDALIVYLKSVQR